jgi:hypothetical protein
MLTQSWSFVQVNKEPKLARINREVRFNRKAANAGNAFPTLRKANGLVVKATKGGFGKRLVVCN